MKQVNGRAQQWGITVFCVVSIKLELRGEKKEDN